MQPLIILIVMLSFIGLYINLTGFNKFSSAELLEENLEKTQVDPLDESIVSEDYDKNYKKPIFNEMGDTDSRKNGLIPGKELFDVMIEKGSAPHTRPNRSYGASAQRIDKKGMPNGGLPYNTYYPYNDKALEPVTANDISNNNSHEWVREPKAMAQLGLTINSTDESKTREATKNFYQASAIIRNALANDNKNLIPIDEIDRGLHAERNEPQKNVTIPDKMSVKNKPSVENNKAARDIMNAATPPQSFDQMGHKLSTVEHNYNFK
jgi:hypothetical protein